jgi:O-antigen/teichoic acid export membrane protein
LSVSGRIARNTATTWIRSLVAAGVAFLLVPLQWNYLGQAAYGTAEVITTVIWFTILADLGLRAALSRHMAECVALDNMRGLNEHYNAALSCYVVLGIALAALFACFAEPLVDRLNIEPSERAAAVALVRYYVTLSALFSFIIPVYAAVIEAYHRFDVTDLVQIGEVLLRAVAIVVLLAGYRQGLYGWAVAMLSARLFSLVVMVLLAHRHCPGLRLGLRFLNRASYVSLFSLGGYLFLYTTIQQVNLLVDPLVVSTFLGSSAVALYRPAALVVTSAYPFVVGLSRQMRPLATLYHSTGQKKRLHEVTIRGTRMTALMAIPFCVIFGAFAFQIVYLWVGREAGPKASIMALVLTFLAISDLSGHIRQTQLFVMTGINRVRYASLVQSLGGLIGVSLGIALIGWLHARGWGERSMIGVVLPNMCLGWIQLAVMSSHVGQTLGIGRRRYFIQAFGRPLIVLSIVVAFAVTLNGLLSSPGQQSTPQAIVLLLTSVTATGLVWLAACWLIGFDDFDRGRMQMLVRRLWARLVRIAGANQNPAEAKNGRPSSGLLAEERHDALDDAQRARTS